MENKSNRPALLTAIFFAVAVLFNILLSFRTGMQTGSWQYFARGAVTIIFEILILFSIRLIWQGKVERGIWWILGGLSATLFLTSLLLANIGLIQSVIAISLYYVVVYQTLPSEQWKRAIQVGMVSALATFLADLVPASFRLPAALEFQRPQQVIAGIIVLVNIVLIWARFRTYKIQNKFLVATLSLVFISVAISGGYLLYSIYNNLADQAIHDLSVDVGSNAENIQGFLSIAQSDLFFLSKSYLLERYLTSTPINAISLRSQVANEFLGFAQARLIYDQIRFIDTNGQEIIRVNTYDGISSIVPQSGLQNKADRGYFKESIGLSVSDVYISALDLNVEQGQIEIPYKPVIRYATPVYFNGKLYGIVIVNILAENFLTPLGANLTSSFLVDQDGYYLYHPEEEKRWGRDLKTEITIKDDFPQFAPILLSGQESSSILDEDLFSYTSITIPGESEPRWYLASRLSTVQAFAPANRALSTGLVILLAILLFSALISSYLGRLIASPLVELTNIAEQISAGNLNARSNVTASDESGILAKSFNTMTTQLQSALQDMEKRVENRTKALSTSVEVSQRLSIATDPQQLAVEVVEQIQAAFKYYHAHIYFLDEESGDLIMAGGTGDAGATMLARGHKISHGRGLVGRAAATNSPVLVADVSKAEGWLPNPLLPDTKSEAAIPISSGSQVLGVLDVQQNMVNGLDQEDVRLLQSLAGQVAISLQNARSYEQSKSQAELETLANTIGQKIQRAATVEETLQTAIRELGLALGATRVKAAISARNNSDNKN